VVKVLFTVFGPWQENFLGGWRSTVGITIDFFDDAGSSRRSKME
jgi:hypothetical protein